MKRMTSKYAGKCRECGARFAAGTTIDYDRGGLRGRKAQHVDCANPGGVTDAALALPLDGSPGHGPGCFGECDGLYDCNPSTYRDSTGGARVSHEIITSGGTFYQNRAGRCEDAPCCGCCTM